MTVTLNTDPRLEPGAYISLPGRLYEVEKLEKIGAYGAKLWCINCKTERRVPLMRREMEMAELVKPAPSSTVPDFPEGIE